MNIRLCLPLLAAAALTGAVQAEVPRKQPLLKYRGLWVDSPFTVKQVEGPGQVYNPLTNYVLLGVTTFDGRDRITLLNKRQPTDPRIVIETGETVKGFRIIEVIRQKENPMATVVRMASGGAEGTVAFEEKYLKIAAPKSPSLPGNATPANNAASPQPIRQPRPRIVMPATSGNANQNTRSRSNRSR